MTINGATDNAALRRAIYLILMALALGNMLGRILAVNSVDNVQLDDNRIRRELDAYRKSLVAQGVQGDKLEEALAEQEAALHEEKGLQRPFLSANDRSRWCTLRALVEPDMRVEGAPFAIDKVIEQPRWDTIDMVKRPNGHFYSSKPPVFPALLAGEYWVLYNVFGLSLADDPYTTGRIILVTVNVVPLLLYFLLLARLAERLGTTDWGRIFVVATGCLGTFLTTFSVVLNNHVPAAVMAMIGLYAGYRIWAEGERRPRYFIAAGFFTALLVATELPALAMAALLSCLLLWRAPRRTLCGYVPAAAVVTVAFFAVNWLAYESLKPPYAHRKPGDNWYDYTYQRNGKTYESYWNNPVGVDRGEPSVARYGLHVLVGHHGVFSLSPVWCLSVAGLLAWLRRRGTPQFDLAVFIGGITMVCLLFYVFQTEGNRNYGGMTSGLRWMFWLAPLWLVAMLPAADWSALAAWRRGLALLLLAGSALSVSYPTWNPWVHPWLYNWFGWRGWL